MQCISGHLGAEGNDGNERGFAPNAVSGLVYLCNRDDLRYRYQVFVITRALVGQYVGRQIRVKSNRGRSM